MVLMILLLSSMFAKEELKNDRSSSYKKNLQRSCQRNSDKVEAEGKNDDREIEIR